MNQHDSVYLISQLNPDFCYQNELVKILNILNWFNET